MKSFSLVLLGLLFLIKPVLAQQPSDVHQQTTPPATARFEVIQSQLAAKWTFRLDRYTGRVAQLVRTTNDENAWEEMAVIELPPISAASRARFQLFTSGLAARHTFLIDTDTGQTWYLVTIKQKRPDGSEYEVNCWQRFAR